VAAELQREETKIPLRERVRPVQSLFRSFPRTGLSADKAFYDSLNDERDA
jgi:antitoxin VapB